MFAEQTPINDPLILTSLETSTVAIMDIQGLATFDAVDALMNHRGGRNRGLGEESGVERSVDSGFATTNGNYSRLPFKVHAVSGLSELRIESEKDFNASHTYFPRKPDCRASFCGIGMVGLSPVLRVVLDCTGVISFCV